MSNDCTVCDDASLLQNATCHDKDFRWHILKTLCYIVNLLTEEETDVEPQSVMLSEVIKTFTQMQADYVSYTSVGLLDTTKQLKHINIASSLDADVEFSFDGGTTLAFTVPAGADYQDTFNLTMPSLTSLVMRRTSGDAATSGRIFIRGRY